MSVKTPLSELGLMYADPYEYPTNDAKLWLELLAKASARDRYLFGILTHIRAVGANLAPTGNALCPYKIVPIIDIDKGWSSQAEYDKEKAPLKPYTNILMELFREL